MNGKNSSPHICLVLYTLTIVVVVVVESREDISNQIYGVPSGKNTFICLEGKSMTPRWGEMLFSSVLTSKSHVLFLDS